MTPDVVNVSVFFILALTVLLGAGIWIGLALMALGYLGVALFTPAPPVQVAGTAVWGALSSWTLAALPLFIWMGEILFRTRLSENMFQGLSPWVNRLPGGLLHVSVLASGVFAAVCGSSAATTATVGQITLPELKKRGYDESISIGSLAGAGTLGLLIPPSIILIVYGVAAEVSIVRLFIAGVIPGAILMALFSGYIMLWAWLNPSRMPPPGPKLRLVEKLAASARLIPVMLLITVVILSIYLGIATATEAAVIGVVGAFAIAWWSGSLNRQTFRDSLMGATRLSCMIALIIAGAAYLTAAMAHTGVPEAIATAIGRSNLHPHVLLLLLTVLYIVLGTFLDGISMIVLTAAVVLPAVEAAGFDLIWFGIFVVILVEMAEITPPVGFNLFVLQALAGRSMSYITRAAIPFFLLMLVMLVITTVFPGIATWLPAQMFQR
ncbi:MAG: TRAP transporter large permease [Lautropia sp.]